MSNRDKEFKVLYHAPFLCESWVQASSEEDAKAQVESGQFDRSRERVLGSGCGSVPEVYVVDQERDCVAHLIDQSKNGGEG